jgi:hypothetical protein
MGGKLRSQVVRCGIYLLRCTRGNICPLNQIIHAGGYFIGSHNPLKTNLQVSGRRVID